MVEVESQNGSQLKSIYAHLDCDCFTQGARPSKNDVLYVDDNGLFRKPADIPGVFRIKGQPQPLVGHGLILGIDEEGESTAPNVTIEQVTSIVTWSSVAELEEYLGQSLPIR